MSAFMVSNEHINALVTTALENRDFSYYYEGERHYLSSKADANLTGKMLLAENLRSINERYGESEGLDNYSFEYSLEWTPIEIIKSCHCYSYQACETDDYEESKAHAFIKGLISAMTHILPGYDAAPWGIDEKKSNGVPLMSLLDA